MVLTLQQEDKIEKLLTDIVDELCKKEIAEEFIEYICDECDDEKADEFLSKIGAHDNGYQFAIATLFKRLIDKKIIKITMHYQDESLDVTETNFTSDGLFLDAYTGEDRGVVTVASLNIYQVDKPYSDYK